VKEDGEMIVISELNEDKCMVENRIAKAGETHGF